jgi:hypothetical protein
VINKKQWIDALDKALEIQETIRDLAYTSRKKDFDNPFRRATYRNLDEMEAAIGTVEDDGFVKQLRSDTEQFKQRVAQAKQKC